MIHGPITGPADQTSTLLDPTTNAPGSANHSKVFHDPLETPAERVEQKAPGRDLPYFQCFFEIIFLRAYSLFMFRLNWAGAPDPGK